MKLENGISWHSAGSEEKATSYAMRENERTLKKNRGVIPPDGGWGWLVAFGGCLNHTLAISLIPSFSLIFSSFFIDNDTSSTTVAWIFNTNQFFWNASSFFSGPLCTRFGWRKVLFCSGLILSVSVILSGFVTKPEHLFLTFSLLTGLGQGFCVIMSFVIVAHYFDQKKGIAIGIVSTGNCFGLFLGPLLVQFLMEHYGRQGATLILGGVLLHSCVAALLFQPVEWHSKKPKEKTAEKETQQLLKSCANDLDSGTTESPNYLTNLANQKKKTELKETPSPSRKTFTWNAPSRTSLQERIAAVCEMSSPFIERKNSQPLEQLPKDHKSSSEPKSKIFDLILENILQLKWHRVHIITFTMTLIISSYTNFLMLVPFSMAEKGHSFEMISFCLALTGVCNLISRIVVTSLTDFVSFSSKYFVMMGSFGLFLSIIMFTMVSSTNMMMLTMSLFGLSIGTCLTVLALVILEFMGLEALPSVLGLLGLLLAVFFPLLGPVSGAIRDATNSYVITAQVLSLAPLLSFLLWFLMPCAISLDKKKEEAASKENYPKEKV